MAEAKLVATAGGNNPPCHTFNEAAESYLTHGGESRYLVRVQEYFGDTDVRAIYPFDIRQMAETLYPNAGGATRNRCAITPARAVLYHAYDRGWRDAIRVRRFREERPAPKEPASVPWMFTFLRQCDRDKLGHLAALVLFMAQTGARISEAVRLQWPDVDLSGRVAVLTRTKTETNAIRHLPDELLDRLHRLDRDLALPVFRYTNRHSVSERIRAV
ncbi:tyrosine-type recombinase/integrase, partial [Oricola sp.]|uniref:tyrosine-type recombinase/integrase n=1 Tax=Oricola sp. TaxID=1979950 RepID=UPI0025F404D6